MQIPGLVFLTFLFLLTFPVSFIFPAFRLVEGSDIFPYDEVFLHFISGLPVFGKGLFFLSHEPGVFRIQILHLRDAIDAQFIKGLLRGLVNRDLFPVGFKELSAVTGLTVCIISRPGVDEGQFEVDRAVVSDIITHSVKINHVGLISRHPDDRN